VHEDVFREVAQAVDLREGPEGVRGFLLTVAGHGPIRLRDAARRVGLPLPVAAAMRRELEKRGLLVREAGMRLSDDGASLLEAEECGTGEAVEYVCPVCEGTGLAIGPEEDALLAEIRAALASRPDADVTLDQAHNTPETALRRVLLMADLGALEARDIVFLGDDDFVSIAVGLARRRLGMGGKGRLVVLEIDGRLVEGIESAAGALDIAVEVVRHDLRHPLPNELHDSFDVFFTDPPYTVPGAALFVSRGVAALRSGPLRQGFLSFGHKDPGTMASLHLDLARMGLAVRRVIPGFNEYEGAAILGNTGQMIHLVTGGRAEALVEGTYEEAMYTADNGARRGGPKGGRRA